MPPACTTCTPEGPARHAAPAIAVVGGAPQRDHLKKHLDTAGDRTLLALAVRCLAALLLPCFTATLARCAAVQASAGAVAAGPHRHQRQLQGPHRAEVWRLRCPSRGAALARRLSRLQRLLRWRDGGGRSSAAALKRQRALRAHRALWLRCIPRLAAAQRLGALLLPLPRRRNVGPAVAVQHVLQLGLQLAPPLPLLQAVSQGALCRRRCGHGDQHVVGRALRDQAGAQQELVGCGQREKRTGRGSQASQQSTAGSRPATHLHSSSPAATAPGAAGCR